MCGICGTTAEPDESTIAAMNAAMAHRGPDDEGIHVDRAAGVALGARRLSIIDVEGGHQPLANEDGTIWAVLNGEIYNFARLRERLLARGHRFATHTDTEVLVHLYEEYGAALVHALEGMFAFAIWDAPGGRLLLGRDRYGEKPLFYTVDGQQLTFASELTALLRSRRNAGKIAAPAVDAYFVLGYVPAPLTIVEGVHQLEPGHVLEWDVRRGRGETTRYWAPPVHALTDGTPARELVSELHELLDRSMQRRLVADVPVGVFLSGGVDSSLVAALAARHTSGPVRTFSVGYDLGRVSETGRAARVAGILGTDHHELILSAGDVRDGVPGMLAELDQPIADAAYVPLRALAGHARSLVTVAVGGEGADEVFGGYPRYRWLARGERLPDWFPHRASARAAVALAPVGPGRAARLAHVLGDQPVFARHLDWVTGGRPHTRAQLYGERLRAAAGHQQDGVPGAVAEMAARGDVAGSLMYLDQIRWLPGDVLAKADRATMRASLEFRTPFLDRTVAEFAAGVPADRHLLSGGKPLLRALVSQLSPGLPVASAKTAFRTPTAEWLRGPLAGALATHVRESRVYADGWFDRATVARWIDEHARRVRDRSGVLWPVFVLGCWLDAQDGLESG